MIKEETLFIIGAGASYPYGFPLGLQLRQKICIDGIELFKRFMEEQEGSPFKMFYWQSQQLVEKFKSSGDESIDWFLRKYPEYTYIGKLLILHFILETEKTCGFWENVKIPSQD
jgi:hypothetical protein